MLSDPLVVTVPVGGIEAVFSGTYDYLSQMDGGQQVTLRTVDIAAQQSARKGKMADGTRVSNRISHSSSKENAPTATDRTLIRFDFTRNDLNGSPKTAGVYFVSAFPQDGTFTVNDMRDFAQALALFILQGGYTGEAVPRAYDLTDSATYLRLLAGEA